MTPLGMLIGGTFKGVWAAGSAAASATGTLLATGVPAAYKYAVKNAPRAVKGAVKTADFMWRHPNLLTGAALGGAGIYAANQLSTRYSQGGSTSPTLGGRHTQVTGASQNQTMMNRAMGNFIFPPGQMASAYAMKKSRQAMSNSTGNLVQGLHRGRH